MQQKNKFKLGDIIHINFTAFVEKEPFWDEDYQTYLYKVGIPMNTKNGKRDVLGVFNIPEELMVGEEEAQ
jgi:hypothetical protein